MVRKNVQDVEAVKAENLEMMATTLGIGAMFNGYPKKTYLRTAPRKKADYKIF